MATTAIETTQQIVLSVRIKGDAGPQTGDVVLGAASFGNFDPTETYEQNEIVVYDGALYRAKKLMNPGEWDPENWEALTDIIARLPDFEPYHEYRKNEIVLFGENLYRAKNNFTSGRDFEPLQWFGIDTVDVCIRDFQPTALYDKDEVVVRDNKLYRAKSNFRAISVFRPEDWDLISDLLINDFRVNFDYKRNNMAVVGGALYRAKQDFTSGTTFDVNDWEKLGSVGIGDFASNTFYSKGSVISHNNKLYLAKADFTSGTAFNTADWEIQADVTVDDFQSNTLYPKNHMVFYDGAIYRAKAQFTSALSWDPNDWELLCPMKVESFSPNTNYYKYQLIVENGSLYRANKAFTSTTTFDPHDWEKLGSNTLQSTYANSSNDFTSPAEVRPTDVTFEERLCANNSDSHIKSFTDNQGGRETLILGVDLDQTSTAVLTAQRTGNNQETADLKITNIDAYAKLGLEQNGSDPYALFELEDNKNEHFKIQVKQGDCKVEMSNEVQNAFTESLGKMSDSNRGLAKTDGRTTRIDTTNDSINAYPIPSAFNALTDYYAGEIVLYQGLVYRSKRDFTSGVNFDMNDWQEIKTTTVDTYTPGKNYYKGDIIVETGIGVADLYYAKVDIPNAPNTRNPNDWGQQIIKAGNVEFTPSAAETITSNNVQMALVELDQRVSDQSIKDLLLDFCYPIGTIYESIKNVSPATFMGGTWNYYGGGRVLVGVDDSDTDFNIPEKTGGEKKHVLTVSELPEHSHDIAYNDQRLALDATGMAISQLRAGIPPAAHTATTANTGSDTAHNNLQPYITAYRWVRTA